MALIGIDGVKLALHQLFTHGEAILFSDQLGGDYFDQIRAERLVTRYSRRHPVRRWEVISSRRNEALDTLTYGYAAPRVVGVDMVRREVDLTRPSGPESLPRLFRSNWGR